MNSVLSATASMEYAPGLATVLMVSAELTQTLSFVAGNGGHAVPSKACKY